MEREPTIDDFAANCASITGAVGAAVKGLEKETRNTLVVLLAGGHVLLEGPPGTGKTLLAMGLAKACGLASARIQFTPDLTPTDIIGATVFERESSTFRFERGPIFTEILVADEINRAPPKTQAALLEAMQERRVSVDGVGYELGERFFVIATQNPIEMEGTYPLPEAQLDRFMAKIPIGYPSEDSERKILEAIRAGTSANSLDLRPVQVVTNASDLDGLRGIPQKVSADDSILAYLGSLVRSTRSAYGVETGASPRAGVALLAAARVFAAASGRDYVVPDDVKELAGTVLAHRIRLTADAELEGLTGASIVASILSTLEVPR